MLNYINIEITRAFASMKEWKDWCKEYCENTSYHKYYLGTPTAFPCVGIEVSTPEGELGTCTTIDTFVYQTHFNLP